jgi:hypothetical protein
LDSIHKGTDLFDAEPAAKQDVIVAAKHAHDATEVSHGLAPGLGDDPQRALPRARVTVGYQAGGASVYDHHAQTVRHDVVELSGYPVAFLLGSEQPAELLFVG